MAIEPFDAFVRGGGMHALFFECVRQLPLHVRRDMSFALPRAKRMRDARAPVSDARAIVSCSIAVNDLVLGAPCVVENDGTRRAITPSEARVRGLTYAAELAVLATRTIVRANGAVDAPVHTMDRIGWLPIMVRSSACVTHNMCDMELRSVGESLMDPGGYFIINGSERAIVAQERRAPREVFVLAPKASSRYTWVADVTSTPMACSVRATTSLQIHMRADPFELVANATYCSVPVHPLVLMRALGVDADDDLVRLAAGDDPADAKLIRSCISGGDVPASVAAARVALRKCVHGHRSPTATANGVENPDAHVRGFLDRDLLPHIVEGGGPAKAHFIGSMVRRILDVHRGRRKPDDRDDYARKRVDATGPLLASVLRQLFKQFAKSTRGYMQKMVNNAMDPDVLSTFREDAVSRGLAQCLATGNWQVGKPQAAGLVRTGVTQPLNRLNLLSCVSNLRRTVTPMSSDGKACPPRLVHNSARGFVCCVETPEGAQCGLTHNYALYSRVGVGCGVGVRMALVAYLTRELGVCKDLDRCAPASACVYLDGAIVGATGDPLFVVTRLRAQRAARNFPYDVSVAWAPSGVDAVSPVCIRTDAGRLLRPLVNLAAWEAWKAAPPPPTHAVSLSLWERALLAGVVDFLDAAEIATSAVVAESAADIAHRGAVSFTHCELHPVALMGVLACTIPASDRNQSPRNTYGSAMCKQAIGANLAGPRAERSRNDTVRSHLLAPQRPLYSTVPSRALGFDVAGTGQNLVVAVLAAFDNIEDAVVLNGDALQRGALRNVHARAFSVSETPGEALHAERIEKMTRAKTHGARPPPSCDATIDDDGMAPVGVYVQCGDTIVGRTLEVVCTGSTRERDPDGDGPPLERGDVRQKINKNHVARAMDHGLVTSTVVTSGAEPTGARTVRTTLCELRSVSVGDKFASRHGQKGVCGRIYRACDMPHTAEGIVPDLIINPHAFVGRMTLGQLVESARAKLGALRGQFQNGTPFQTWAPERAHTERAWDDIDGLAASLIAEGYAGDGTEPMFDGRTGAALGPVTLGVVYYHRMKHMVQDKFNPRDRGPVQCMTRQPVEGRGKNGGQRFGEMERDCAIAHGASAFMRDRTFLSSDYSTTYVCVQCGLFAEAHGCAACNTSADGVRNILCPYACGLLLREFMCMGVAPRIGLENKPTPRPAIGTMAPVGAPSALHEVVDVPLRIDPVVLANEIIDANVDIETAMRRVISLAAPAPSDAKQL